MGGMTEEMRKNRAAEVGDSGSRAMGQGSDLETSIRGGDEDAASRAPSSSLAGMMRGPKKYDFWLDLTIAPQK